MDGPLSPCAFFRLHRPSFYIVSGSFVDETNKIKIKLRSFKSSEHINENGVDHTAVLAT